MKDKVFLKSALRQPFRTTLLLLMVITATFAFVARGVEYLIVNSELDYLEAQYDSIGFLTPSTRPTNVTDDHDVRQVADIISQSSMVATEDRRVFAQGVMHDTLNTSTLFSMFRPFLAANIQEIELNTNEHYFVAYVDFNIPPTFSPGHRNIINMRLNIIETLSGEYDLFRIRVAQHTGAWAEFLPQADTTIPVRILLTDEETEAVANGTIQNPIELIEPGVQYVFRVTNLPNVDSWWAEITNIYIRPLIGNDGMHFDHFTEVSIEHESRDPFNELTFFAPVTAGVHLAPDIVERMEMNQQNLQSVMVIATQDMTTMPRFQDPRFSRLVSGALIDGGRWLNYEDYVNQNPVVVIPAQLATRRGVMLGDTITIDITENTRPIWIDQGESSNWAAGTQNWWDSIPQAWWATTEGLENWQNREYHTLELEVVGIYWNLQPGANMHNYLNSELYIPLSIFPNVQEWDDMPLLSRMYSFSLNSPRIEQRFLNEYREVFASLGFNVSFFSTDFENFAAATDPIRLSLLINLVIFTIVSIAIFTLAVFLYLKQWRKTVAFGLALGSTTSRIIRHILKPVVLMWVPAIIVGSALAWIFAVSQATSAIDGATEEIYAEAVSHITTNPLLAVAYEAPEVPVLSVPPRVEWLLYLGGIVAFMVFAAFAVALYSVAKKPILEQLQGSVQKVKKVKLKESDLKSDLPDGFEPGKIPKLEKPKRTKKGKREFKVGFITKHILRAPMRSGLLFIMAALVVMSLGWINHTIITLEEEIEYLWDTTVITVEIVEDVSAEQDLLGRFAGWSYAIASHELQSAFVNSPFTQNVYFESIDPAASINLPFVVASEESGEYDALRAGMYVIGVNDLETFLEINSRNVFDDAWGVEGEDLYVTFADGFGPEDFVHNSGEPVPALLSMRTLEGNVQGFMTVEEWLWDIEQTEEAIREKLLGMLGEETTIFAFQGPEGGVPARIIGIYNEGMERGINRFTVSNALVIPHASMYYMTRNSWVFDDQGWRINGLMHMTLQGEITPEFNRDISLFITQMESAIEGNSFGWHMTVPDLIIHLDDGGMMVIISAIEQNLVLIRILYPLAIGLAIILALGVAALAMLQNAKNAAVMRVLGMTSIKCQLTLWVEQTIIAFVGVIVGLLLQLIMGANIFLFIPLVLAGAYLLSAGLGAYIGAFIINFRSPLAMLQVRE